MHFIFNLRHKNKLQKLGCFIDNMTFKKYIGKTVMYSFFSHCFLLANEECICLSLMSSLSTRSLTCLRTLHK